jgi:hypothetical protein
MRVPKRSTGADRPVVARMSGNSDGAKGSDGLAGIGGQPRNREEPKTKAKSFEISKWKVWEAYKRVKANRGGNR